MTQVNSDRAEVAKFDALAGEWWDSGGKLKTLHAINPLRLDYIERRCGGIKGRRVADIGCGGGILAEALARRGGDVVGVDCAAEALAVARQHAAEAGVAVDYRQLSAEQLAAQEPERFDVVTCLELLEHIPDPASVVTACARLAKPHGHLFFSTLNRNPKSWLLAIVGAEYLLRLLPRGTHQFQRFIKPAELDHWLRGAGLAMTHLTGLHYNPVTQRYWLDPDAGPARVDVNYLVHCRPWALTSSA